MMNDFKCTNIAGIKWLKKPVEQIGIKVQLKPQDGIISLPKFEDYADETNGLNLDKLENKTEAYNFKWQEKIFSLWELQRYSDVHNCISEHELAYNELIQNEDYTPSKIFSYIHEDFRLPLPCKLNNDIPNEGIPDFNSLNMCFEKLGLNENIGRMVCMVGDTSSTGHLFRSMENIPSETNQWIAMHIAYDHSEYNEDSQLLLKQETILLSLYHNRGNDFIIISPDVNSLDLTPYALESELGVSLGYVYSVEVGFGDSDDKSGEELETLLKKLHKKWDRRHKQIVNFEMPSIGQKLFYVMFELLSADGFDMDNLYIEFDIKIQEELKCSDMLQLHHRTHVAKSMNKEEMEEWHFGHHVELCLETEATVDPPPLQLFFEVISTDWWGRHRTEGYCYLPLTLVPGRYSKQLSCSRPEELDSSIADSRRFFVGGCHLIRDLDVLAKPQLIDANYKFATTGNIHVRWSVLSQAPLPGLGTLVKQEPYESHVGGSANALLQGAEAVLRQYKMARERLSAATEGLPNTSIPSQE